MIKKIYISIILIALLAMPLVLALKENGETCIIDAECNSGWCNHICIPNPCIDGKCELDLDCELCPEKNYGFGDCLESDCGFDTSRCYDGKCEVEVDCFCYNNGDCDEIQCSTGGLLNLTRIIFLVLLVVAIVYIKKISKRRKRK